MPESPDRNPAPAERQLVAPAEREDVRRCPGVDSEWQLAGILDRVVRVALVSACRCRRTPSTGHRQALRGLDLERVVLCLALHQASRVRRDGRVLRVRFERGRHGVRAQLVGESRERLLESGGLGRCRVDRLEQQVAERQVLDRHEVDLRVVPRQPEMRGPAADVQTSPWSGHGRFHAPRPPSSS